MSTAAQPVAYAQADRFGFLHVDLNSFFASVEQERHPEFHGRPTAVVGTMADTGTIIAASYEAKALKIKTGTKVGEARGALPGDHPRQRIAHHLCGVFAPDCGGRGAGVPGGAYAVDRRDGVSADGVRTGAACGTRDRACGQAGHSRRRGANLALFHRYGAQPVPGEDRQRHAEAGWVDRSGCPASYRAPSRISSCATCPGWARRPKPDCTRRGSTPCPSFWRSTETACIGCGIRCGGDRLFHWLRGHATGDDGAPLPSDLQKSLGHSHVLGPEHRSQAGAWAVAHKLLHKAAMRLRMEHFHAGTMAVTVKFALSREEKDRLAGAKKIKKHTSGITGTAWGMEAKFQHSQDTLTLLEVLQSLWKQRPDGPEHQRPFFVGVTLRNLLPEGEPAAAAVRRARASQRTFGHHGQAEPQVRAHHGALRRHAAGARLGTDTHRLHANSGAIWCGLYVSPAVWRQREAVAVHHTGWR